MPIALALSVVAACGQPASFETPVLGHAYDAAAGSIRPIVGVPGAAWFDAPMPAEEALGETALAPRRNYALTTAGGRLLLARWAGGAISLRPFAEQAERIAFSLSGASVALQRGGVIEVWTGMPDAAALARRIEHGGPIDALAVSDDGAAVAVGSAGTVLLYDSGGTRVVTEGGRIASLAFAPHSRTLAAADLELNRVLVMGAASHEVERPSHVAFSADGRKLAVASAARSAVTLIELDSGREFTIGCECEVETLAPARGNAVFRLRASAKGRAPMLDGDGAEPRIVFIAAGEESK